MNTTLSLSPEQQTALQERAAAEGEDIASHIMGLVVQALESEQNGSSPDELPYEQWLCDFETWVTSHSSHNPDFDDSRESIYD